MEVIKESKAGGLEENSSMIKECIRSHGVIAFPTDTVNGIGCSPYDKLAIRKLLSIKSRDPKKGLPVLVSSKSSANMMGFMDKNARVLAERFWPGALTLVVKLKNKKISAYASKDGKIALRMPDNAIALELARLCGGAIIGTSANISGKKTLSMSRIERELDGIDIAIEGYAGHSGKNSTIFDTVEMRIMRGGEISKKEIEKEIGKDIL